MPPMPQGILSSGPVERAFDGVTSGNHDSKYEVTNATAAVAVGCAPEYGAGPSELVYRRASSSPGYTYDAFQFTANAFECTLSSTDSIHYTSEYVAGAYEYAADRGKYLPT